MTEANNGSLPQETVTAAAQKKPGIVIFVAIIHFLSAAFFGFLSLTCVLAIAFGAALGTDNYLAQQVSRFSPPNASFGLTLVLAMALAALLCLTAFFLSLAIGLLKGKKFAWYLQVAFSTVGLLGLPLGFLWAIPILPLGTLLNIVILIFFFRSRIRGYFKV